MCTSKEEAKIFKDTKQNENEQTQIDVSSWFTEKKTITKQASQKTIVKTQQRGTAGPGAPNHIMDHLQLRNDLKWGPSTLGTLMN